MGKVIFVRSFSRMAATCQQIHKKLPTLKNLLKNLVIFYLYPKIIKRYLIQTINQFSAKNHYLARFEFVILYFSCYSFNEAPFLISNLNGNI